MKTATQPRVVTLGLLALCFATATAPSLALAKPRALPGLYTRLDLPAEYVEIAAPAGVAHVFVAEKAGYQVIVTRFDLTAPVGWKDEPAHFDQVEKSVATAAPGYKRLRRKSSRDGHVRVLDLVFSRGPTETIAKEVIATRWMFFRTFALAVSASRIDPLTTHRRDADTLSALTTTAKRSDAE